ncbi:MAG: putative ABC transporter permease [Coriobacteriia bacterium]|nr:putative ABC transporter permease [Coriobacteriia bacterium]
MEEPMLQTDMQPVDAKGAAEPAECAELAKPADSAQPTATTKPSKFNENSGLGFMWVLIVLNIIAIFMEFVVCLFMKGSSISLDFFSISTALEIVLAAVTTYLLITRRAVARYVTIINAIVSFAISMITQAMVNDLAIESVVSNAIWAGLVIVYFLTSRRAKAVLVRPFAPQTQAQAQEALDRTMWDPKSRNFWLRLLIYFFVFSVMGHWMEMLVQVLVVNGLFPGTVAASDSLTWRDNMNPFFIYGIAVAFCGLALYPIYMLFRRKCRNEAVAYVLSFLVNTLFCVAAELILGYLFNQDYHAWDYRDQFLNFDGQICLLYTLAFGIFASLITWQVYPFLEWCFGHVNKEVFGVIFFASLILFVLIVLTYNIDLDELAPGTQTITQADLYAASTNAADA